MPPSAKTSTKKTVRASANGTTISTGLWWGDIDTLCARFGVKALPHFNGGIYYLEPGPQASAVFTRARELEQQYDAQQRLNATIQSTAEVASSKAAKKVVEQGPFSP